MFLREVRSQQALPALRLYLRLYSSAPLPKLASLLETDVATLRTNLLCLRNKSSGLRWTGGADLTSGSFVSTGARGCLLASPVAVAAQLACCVRIGVYEADVNSVKVCSACHQPRCISQDEPRCMHACHQPR